MTTSTADYQRSSSLELEDDWVAVKSSPFSDRDSYTLPAVAVDWNCSQAAFHVTLLTLSNDKTEEKLWTASFSISKIRRRHFELCLVYPDLKNHLPALPNESQGFWGYIQWIKVSPTLCKKLEEYVKEAFNVCGWKLFSSVFFGEPTLFDEDYTISSLELKRNKYVRELEQILENLQQSLVEKSQVDTMDKLFEWYEKLYDLLTKVNVAERKLLEFDCDPFEELRDIAQKERTEYAAVFNQQSLTASSFQDSSQNFTQWEEQYVESVKKINEFRLEYCKTSLSRLECIRNIMKDDLPKFSGSDEERVSARLGEIEKEITSLEIKVLNCIHQAKVLERDKLRQDAITLDEDLGLEEALKQKESAFYKKQDEILNIEYEIQDKNEKIIQLDLKTLENYGNGENVNYPKETKEKMTRSLSNIFRKKAILRNKRNACKAAIKRTTEKEEQKQLEYARHHGVQMKIERRREEEVEKKDARLEERQRTLLRLKEYKKKHEKAKVVKPPRYQPPSTRKKEQTLRTDSSRRPCQTRPSVSPTPKKPNIEKATTAEQLPEKVPRLPASAATPDITITPLVHLPPPSPPPPPPPPPPISLPLPISGVHGTGLRSAGHTRRQIQDSNSVSSPSVIAQPSSLSEETVNLEAILLARDRLKKKQDTSAGATESKQKSFPSGNDLTRAIQSVKLRKVINEEKPTDLSPDGAEFLKKALERMNRFTTLSYDDEEDKGDELEQEW